MQNSYLWPIGPDLAPAIISSCPSSSLHRTFQPHWPLYPFIPPGSFSSLRLLPRMLLPNLCRCQLRCYLLWEVFFINFSYKQTKTSKKNFHNYYNNYFFAVLITMWDYIIHLFVYFYYHILPLDWKLLRAGSLVLFTAVSPFPKKVHKYIITNYSVHVKKKYRSYLSFYGIEKYNSTFCEWTQRILFLFLIIRL